MTDTLLDATDLPHDRPQHKLHGEKREETSGRAHSAAFIYLAAFRNHARAGDCVLWTLKKPLDSTRKAMVMETLLHNPHLAALERSKLVGIVV
jgi:hypothetical protein